MSDSLVFGDRPDILFLIGCWLGESKRYRVYNLAAALEARGYKCTVYDFFRVRDVIALNIIPEVVVFFRAPYDPGTGVIDAMDHFRRHRVVTVFDVDDYVFEPSVLPYVAALEHFGHEAKFDYAWGVRAYRSLLFSCDKATASTDFLTQRMREMGREAYTVSNTLNTAQISLAEELVSQPLIKTDEVRICYYSGSSTHQRDFAVCERALQEVMQQHSNVRFRLVGLLELDGSWLPFAERIERAGFMDSLDMLRDMRRCDINIAPLEEGNPFCEGKSELKFFEAAIIEVPTIASRTAPYRGVIEDGVNGMLASDPAEWKTKLCQMVSSVSERCAMAAKARVDALERFSPDVAARMALAAYGLETLEETEATVSRGHMKIGWILPDIMIGGGGHRNILRAAYHLERFGYDVRLYVINTTLGSAALRRQIRRHFYPFAGPVSKFAGSLDGEDVVIATHWSTVDAAEAAADEAATKIYFVQDFEPAFYPMGSEYLLAEDTYRRGLYAICSGPWCARLLKANYGMDADYFRFPIDRQVYHAQIASERSNRILFFAKPEMPRRCYSIGVEALRLVKRMRPEIEIMFFGSASEEIRKLDFTITQLAIVPTLDDLARLYANSQIGVVFSTTNPSLVPYEMMACGLPVVDLDLPGATVNYGDRRDIALLAGPLPQRIADQIVALLDDEKERAARTKAGMEFVDSLPSEKEMARRIEKLILQRIDPQMADLKTVAG